LRAVLALWVILHHLTGPGMMLDAWCRSLPAAAGSLLRGGYLAVATFFVLSGFVLARSYGSAAWDRAGVARYAAARAARIYPVYLLSLLLVSPFIAAERLPLTGGRLFTDKASLLANYGLLLQGWTGPLAVGWNTPAWSLSCEVFFYLCFPLLAVGLPRMRWPAIAVTGAAMCVGAELLPAAGVPVTWKPLIHLADFVMGMAAAHAYPLVAGGSRLRGRGYWLYAPALAAGAALIAWPGALGGRMEVNTPLRPLNALLLVGFALGGGLPARLLSARASVFLGQASYAMYILHVPLLWWFARLAPKAPVRLAGTPAGFVFVAAVVVVSSLVYRFFEEPANRWLRRRLRPA
jgi:peptidoglycan/LPS O-acetylase OafA/YrhL